MADEEPKVIVAQPVERKSVTHKQVLGGAGIAMAVYFMPQLQTLFWTRQEGVAINERVTTTQSNLDSLKSELKTDLAQAKFDIISEVRAAEGRTSESQKRIESRVNRLEDIALRLSPKRKSDN